MATIRAHQGNFLACLIVFICIHTSQSISSIHEQEFCTRVDKTTKTCTLTPKISGSQTTCNGRGNWNPTTGVCDCETPYDGVYCQTCATGFLKSFNGNCSQCDTAAGYTAVFDRHLQRVTKCYRCPCTKQGYEAITRNSGITRPTLPNWRLVDEKNKPCSGTTFDASGKTEIGVCLCKNGWGGTFCTQCAPGYFPEPDIAKKKGVDACTKLCDPKSVTHGCGDGSTAYQGSSNVALGECNAMGVCKCYPGAYANETGNGCIRCKPGDSKMNGKIDVCDPKYITPPAPSTPTPPPQPPAEELGATGGDKCKNKPKWWIGAIIGASVALLLVLIAGVVVMLMMKPKSKPGGA